MHAKLIPKFWKTFPGIFTGIQCRTGHLGIFGRMESAPCFGTDLSAFLFRLSTSKHKSNLIYTAKTVRCLSNKVTSLPFTGQVPKQTTVRWSICSWYIYRGFQVTLKIGNYWYYGYSNMHNVTRTWTRTKYKFIRVFVLFLSITLKQFELPSSTPNHLLPIIPFNIAVDASTLL